MRLHRLQPGAAPRPQVLPPPRRVRPDPDRRARRAGRSLDHRRPPAPQGRRRERRTTPRGTPRASRCSRATPWRASARIRAAWRDRRRSEDIEHLGTVGTHVLDLERTWRSETERRRVLRSATNARPIDLGSVVPAEPATVWAYLTSPGLRPSWEGPIVIAEATDDGRRGIGTQSQCVTGRLATLEEIVDWQPFDHVGYRLSMPGLGAADATYDLAPDVTGTAVRMRWAAAGPGVIEFAIVDRLRSEKAGALVRLATVLGSAAPPEMVAGRREPTGGSRMIRYSSDVTIDRPPSAVFEALLNPDLYAKWTPMIDMTFEDDGPPRRGTAGAVPHGGGSDQGPARDGDRGAGTGSPGRCPGHPPGARAGWR